MWTQGLLLSVLPQGRALSLGTRGPTPWVVWPGWRFLCSMTGLVVISCLNVHSGCLRFPRDPGWDGGQEGSSQCVLGTVCVCVWQREAFLKQRGPSSPTLSEQAKANKQSYPLILLARHVVSNLNGLSSYTPPKTGSDTLKMLLLARLIWPGNIQVR